MAKQTPPPKIEPSRPGTPTYTTEVYIWNTITSVNNTEIIWTQLVSQALGACFLQLCFLIRGLIFTGNNTRLILNVTVLLFLFKINSRLFFSKVLENLPYSKLASGSKLSKISNINRRK